MKAKALFKPQERRSKAQGEHALWLSRCKGLKVILEEPWTFKLGDRIRYTPDFMTIREDGIMELHEVKGRYKRKGKEDLGRGSEGASKAKFKVAATMYPWFIWRRFTKRIGRKNEGGSEWLVETHPWKKAVPRNHFSFGIKCPISEVEEPDEGEKCLKTVRYPNSRPK